MTNAIAFDRYSVVTEMKGVVSRDFTSSSGRERRSIPADTSPSDPMQPVGEKTVEGAKKHSECESSGAARYYYYYCCSYPILA